jgi:hypothetical protein
MTKVKLLATAINIAKPIKYLGTLGYLSFIYFNVGDLFALPSFPLKCKAAKIQINITKNVLYGSDNIKSSQTYNATLSGKKLLAKIVNGVKQSTVFCPFERLVRQFVHLRYVYHSYLKCIFIIGFIYFCR